MLKVGLIGIGGISDAYANELRYFTDCVLENRFPDKVKSEELKDVVNILNQL